MYVLRNEILRIGFFLEQNYWGGFFWGGVVYFYISDRRMACILTHDPIRDSRGSDDLKAAEAMAPGVVEETFL